MINHIKKMLRIIEKDLTISRVNQEIYHKRATLVIYAKLSPKPSICKLCGSKAIDHNNKPIIVKNGTKEVTVMKLKKQRFLCKNCQSYSTSQTYFVKENCSIAEHVRFKIIHLPKEKISCQLISNLCGVSAAIVIRVLQSLESYLPAEQHEKSLPKVLMVDEFCSHAKNEDKMSFICSDGETGKIVDILPSRKEQFLEKHFQINYPQALDKVKFIVTDMNAPYFK